MNFKHKLIYGFIGCLLTLAGYFLVSLGSRSILIDATNQDDVSIEKYLPEALKPYTPSRLEWLQFVLNGSSFRHKMDQLDDMKGISVFYNVCNDMIEINVSYDDRTTANDLEFSIDTHKKFVQSQISSNPFNYWDGKIIVNRENSEDYLNRVDVE